MSKAKITAEYVRENFPASTAIANEFRDVFGDVKLLHADESGQQIGKMADESACRVVTGKDMCLRLDAAGHARVKALLAKIGVKYEH